MDARSLEEHFNHRLFVRGMFSLKDGEAYPTTIDVTVLTMDADDANLRFTAITSRASYNHTYSPSCALDAKVWTKSAHRMHSYSFFEEIDRVLLERVEFQDVHFMPDLAVSGDAWAIFEPVYPGFRCHRHTHRCGTWLLMFGYMHTLRTKIASGDFTVGEGCGEPPHETRWGLLRRIDGWITEQMKQHVATYGM